MVNKGRVNTRNNSEKARPSGDKPVVVHRAIWQRYLDEITADNPHPIKPQTCRTVMNDKPLVIQVGSDHTLSQTDVSIKPPRPRLELFLDKYNHIMELLRTIGSGIAATGTLYILYTLLTK